MNSRPLIATHSDYLLHDMGEGHPESPERLRGIRRHLESSGLLARCEVVDPRSLEGEILRLNHSEHLVERVRRASEMGGGALDGDTYANAESYRVALLSAGAVVGLSERVWKEGAAPGFALVRPPGHHAEPQRAMGFCFFNNVAVAADHLIKNFGAKRVAIFDPDLHHGNGTQASFFSRKDVLYLSTHQYPYYPGTGHYTEAGKGEGEGFTVNVPLPPGQGDAEFVYLYREVLLPIVREFSPDFILVSAGFDTYHLDPLGGMKVTEQGFAWLSRMLLDLARETCGGRIVFALEGGYHVEGLARSVGGVVGQMLGEGEPLDPGPPDERIVRYAADLRRFFGQWWKVLR
ncbi:MAG: histone deacetylase [Bdellovibrionota bacterium]